MINIISSTYYSYGYEKAITAINAEFDLHYIAIEYIGVTIIPRIVEGSSGY